MKNYYSYFNKRVINALKRTLLLAIVAWTGSTPIAYAQNQLSQQQLVAVMTIVNMYLLDSDIKVELEFNKVDGGSYSVSKEFEIFLPQPAQTEDVEFCFVLDTNQDLSALNVSLTADGTPLPDVVLGENCYVLTPSQQQGLESLLFSVGGTGTVSLSVIGIEPAVQSQIEDLSSLTRSTWDERAVRKVLKIFAFGGHATDQQIITWANMNPGTAIAEMLNFDEHNFKLSPVSGERYTEHTQQQLSVDVLTREDIDGDGENDDVVTPETVRPGTLYGWQHYMRARNTNYPVPAVRFNSDGDPNYPRDQYGLNGYNFDDAYNRMITVRGLNPFRQRIGFWETNYHLATNLDANVSRRQMARYYDLIMDAHAAGLPYKDVMGIAAKSAAIAVQYGHRNNRWNSNTEECECNEDFAREIHQLFYGIFGDWDPIKEEYDPVSGPEYHENTAIPNTAKMLTDMRIFDVDDHPDDGVVVDFGTTYHHLDPLTILGQTVAGADASAKIDNLMPYSIEHRESLQNLPVMIVSVLANDNLTEANKQELRDAWGEMDVDRNFLEFIRAYATSQQFHGSDQFKYFTTHERALYIANKHNLDNIEAYFGGGSYNGGRLGRTVGSIVGEDFAGDFFRPIHNVFGGQTSVEASDSALVFENNYNRLTEGEYDLRRVVDCEECDLGDPWVKRWDKVLPKRADGNFYVADVAEWLWKHAVGNMDNYSILERAHLHSLLGAARDIPGNDNDGDHAFDFNLVMCVMADYASDDQNFMNGNATITDILASSSKWDDYCRGNSGTYEQHELDELNAQYTGEQLTEDRADGIDIQVILTELGNETIPLNASGPQHANDGENLRRHARERVSSALGFIFTTPFVFAEGQ